MADLIIASTPIDMETFWERRASALTTDAERPSLDDRLHDRGRVRLGLPRKQADNGAAIRPSALSMDWHPIASSCEPLSSTARTSIHSVWVPLRHVGWAASLSTASLTLPKSRRRCATPGLDLSVLHLRWACFFSALGWALGGADALRSARRIWLEDPAWQALRRYAEDALALHDPLERASAMNLMTDGLLRPLLGARALRRCVGHQGAALASYFDALIESSTAWSVSGMSAVVAQWAPRAASAALPLIERVWGQDTDEKLGAAMDKIASWASPDGDVAGMRCG